MSESITTREVRRERIRRLLRYLAQDAAALGGNAQGAYQVFSVGAPVGEEGTAAVAVMRAHLDSIREKVEELDTLVAKEVEISKDQPVPAPRGGIGIG